MEESIRNVLEQYGIDDVFGPVFDPYFTRHTFTPGERICTQGEQAERLFVLIEGKLKISTTSPEGKRLVLSFKHPLDLIGDIEYVQRTDLMNTVEAVTPVTVLGIPYEALVKHGSDDPVLLRFLLETITQKFFLKSNSLSFNLLYPVEVRLASYLLSMTPIGEVLEEMALSDVADLIGTSYRHLNRVLRDFEQDGLIERRRGSVRLLDRSALQMRAGNNIYE
ncbi:Crp/Fnr family transcriptional regulator [Exiguobacterium flavidum]|uniref:Crp/Fnr family transcriptional regulator n=1 Tax=Exiguobacterium flavidum TaxID=2184695 RepID=UPI000DF80672|nr:Crp/Fnr family transcriptional regulator [Exiguobacterium flavidum]